MREIAKAPAFSLGFPGAMRKCAPACLRGRWLSGNLEKERNRGSGEGKRKGLAEQAKGGMVKKETALLLNKTNYKRKFV